MIDFALQKTLHTAEGEMQLHVNATIEGGKFISLYGASGTGKTSLLRMLAGFMKPDDGFIRVNGTVWYDASQRYNVAPQQRKIGFVFQDYALFPNMSVRENISFALDKNDSQKIVDEMLELTGLSSLAARRIQTLSGGQQQRVALARALAKKPSILLLDEPLSAIDNAMRVQLQETLLELHKRFALTTILVSHDEKEIIRLSDLVIHLEQGRFKELTRPTAFFRKERSTLVLTGSVVSVEENGSIGVLIDDRILSINPDKLHFNVDDKIELNCNKDNLIVRKP